MCERDGCRRGEENCKNKIGLLKTEVREEGEVTGASGKEERERHG